MTNEKETYNGWSNYATWRIKLEMLDTWATYHVEEKDYEVFSTVRELANHLKDYVIEALDSEAHEDNTKIYDYAMAFLGEVDWYEIAKSIADEYSEFTIVADNS